AEVIRHVSALPWRDLHKLYRQMVFNVMIGNTDDHLKNFIMLHNDEGWRLSPAFDLVPNIGFNREHVLRIGYDNRPPDFEILMQEARHFGLKRQQQAKKVVMEVHEAISGWSTVFTECNVPKKDAESIGKDISHRLKETNPASFV
ncbi:MAG: HipA domain-containing protein, partial [Deltaproteobacteria bacterium]|nr:HipA domain-containing protein [Deltaproteobacteria bacterium]